MSWAAKAAARLLAAGMTLSFLALIVTVLTQVFARVFLPKVPSWTEEVSRFLLIWMVSFGAGLAMRNRSFVNVDIVTGLLPARARKALQMLSSLLVIAFMCVFTVKAWDHLALGRRQTSSALYLPMQYVFYALVVMGAGIVFFGLVALVGDMRDFGRTEEPRAPLER